MLHPLLFLFGADVFALPRVDFDLHPGTMAFMIFCGALTMGILVGIVSLGLYSEDREAERGQAAAPSAEETAGDPEPFIPDDAKPDVSESVDRLFERDDTSALRS